MCGRRVEGKRWRLMTPKTSGIGSGELKHVQFTGLGNQRHWMITVEDNIQAEYTDFDLAKGRQVCL